jgi:hypothetical protein
VLCNLETIKNVFFYVFFFNVLFVILMMRWFFNYGVDQDSEFSTGFIIQVLIKSIVLVHIETYTGYSFLNFYAPDELSLIHFDKQLPQSPFTGQYFNIATFCFGVYSI